MSQPFPSEQSTGSLPLPAEKPDPSWTSMLGPALIALLAGIVVVSWPSGTVKVVGVIVGIQLIGLGLLRLVAVVPTDELRTEEHSDRWKWVHAVIAGLAIVAGILVLLHPFQTVSLLALIVGLFWIANGVTETFAALTHRSWPHRGVVIGFGLFTLAAGIVVVTHPGGSILALSLLIGIWLMLFGLFGVFRAFDMRSESHRRGQPGVGINGSYLAS